VHPFIRLYPDMLPAARCREIRARFDGDARVGAGRALGAADAKRCRELVITQLPEWAEASAAIRATVQASAGRYREDVLPFKLIHKQVRDSGYQIQRYDPNGSDGFDWHADAINRDSCTRLLAMILYLNDVADGGETEFFAQKLKVQPRAGAVLWFPAGFEYMHRGLAPRSEAKYIVTTFLVYP